MGWLRKHLAYANGIPCKDTFRQMRSGLSSVAFERCFIEWAGCLCPSLLCGPARRDGRQDGKRQRGP
ncbi:MAG: hypothetical protein VB142_09980 [Burkholderia sp.]